MRAAVVGGGATGIELIAELHSAVRIMASYGIHFNPDEISFTLIHAYVYYIYLSICYIYGHV